MNNNNNTGIAIAQWPFVKVGLIVASFFHCLQWNYSNRCS